jgi:hypothetical protein
MSNYDYEDIEPSEGGSEFCAGIFIWGFIGAAVITFINWIN